MNIEQRIEQFNETNAPFYIVDHDNGRFSLCLALSFMGDEYANFGQEAFNRYAQQIGEPIMDRGLYTHGSGYEWETVFKKAFECDANLCKITFDCEASGFFCYAPELPLIEDFGRRFRAMVANIKGFSDLVSAALEEAAVREAAERELRNTVRGFLMEVPESNLEIMMPEGLLYLTSKQGQQLLDGSLETVKVGDTEIRAEGLLNYKITQIQQDLFFDDHFQMIAEPPEETPASVLSM